MAHARLAGIFRVGEIDPAIDHRRGRGLLACSRCRRSTELMKALLDFPALVAGAAEALEPHRVATYLHETARQDPPVVSQGARAERARADHAARGCCSRAPRRSCCATGSRCSASPRRSGCSRWSSRVAHRCRPSHRLIRFHSSSLNSHVRTRRRLGRAGLRRNAVRQGRQRPRRLGHLLLRVGQPPRRRCSSSAWSATTTRWRSSSR